MLDFLSKEDQTTPMQKIVLNGKEKIELESRHASCQDGKARDRIKAVLLSTEGWSTSMIAQALRLHETTILRHLNDFLEGKTKAENGGSSSHLTERQTQALAQHLEANLYHSVEAIIDYVKTRWGVSYSIPGMNHWLHKHGFSYKKPKGYPAQSRVSTAEQVYKEV